MLLPSIFSVAAGTALVVMLQVANWRRSPSSKPRMGLLFRISLVGAFVAVDFFGAFFAYRLGGLMADAVAFGAVSVLLMFGFVMMGYFFVYSGICRSVSLTLLIQLWETEGSTIPFDTLLGRYAASDRFEDRIVLMRDAGLVRLDGTRVEITPKGRRMAAVSRVLASCLGTTFEG